MVGDVTNHDCASPDDASRTGGNSVNDRRTRADEGAVADPDAAAYGYPRIQVIPTRVCQGASIGFGTVILRGVTIGAGPDRGAVVAQDVAPRQVVAGVPARLLRCLPESRGDTCMRVPHAHDTISVLIETTYDYYWRKNRARNMIGKHFAMLEQLGSR
jgi:hypothetical protein